MALYVIYNRKTGQIVQTHVLAAETSREEILGHLGKGHDAANLDVQKVDENTVSVGQAYHFNTSAGRLEPSHAGSGSGFGAGSATPAAKSQQPAPRSHPKITFRPADPRKPAAR